MKKIDENSILYEHINTIRRENVMSNNMRTSYRTDSFYENGELYFLLSLLEDYEEIELVLISGGMDKNAEAFVVYGEFIAEIDPEIFHKERMRQDSLEALRKNKKSSLEETIKQMKTLKSDVGHMEGLGIFKNNPYTTNHKFLRSYMSFCQNLGFARKAKDYALDEFSIKNIPVYVYRNRKDEE